MPSSAPFHPSLLKRAPLRSALFDLGFYGLTAIACIALLPALLLPRRAFLGVVNFYHYLVTGLEYGILGLRYEVRGREHLPQNGSYLVAAKHMSPYETLKLRLLFKDPAIILKKELLAIPLWGWFLKKSDVIAIDRAAPDRDSLNEGALRMKLQGRPIVIFPQGTRVWPHETAQDKPYKSGIARLQATTDLSIIPMATNSGLFWPRSGWLKSPGTVIFEFLKPIPAGGKKEDVMAKLAQEIENKSQALMEEARTADSRRKSGKGRAALLMGLGLALILFGAYSYGWKATARHVRAEYTAFLERLNGPDYESALTISGYPGPVTARVAREELKTKDGHAIIEALEARIWPLPFVPSIVQTGPVTVKSFKWPEPLMIDRVEAIIVPRLGGTLDILDSTIAQGDFTGKITGTADLAQRPVPKLDLMIALENHPVLLLALARNQIIGDREALFLSAGFSALADPDGIVRVPLVQKGTTLYAGPLAIAELPVESLPGSALPAPGRRNITAPPPAPPPQEAFPPAALPPELYNPPAPGR
ncbi:MAG: 1-acyl-sn-glycerol-3-phosphate acyltransferase [Alphaproteobacteria bacterium]|nr:1-acyl-sn-glycerol-3-phosphate acyltransferase [Alphaproteobacteria bacterium]